MRSPRYLTKSRFKLAAECPTKLFYTGKPYLYQNLKQEDSFLAMLADGGYQVGVVVKPRRKWHLVGRWGDAPGDEHLAVSVSLH